MANNKDVQAAIRYVARNFEDFIQKLQLRENEDWEQLRKLFPNSSESESNRWNTEKAKTVLKLLRSDKDDIERILSFLDHSELGWHIDRYWLVNRGLRKCNRECKAFCGIPLLRTEEVCCDLNNIFLHDRYGTITTYLFGYCIAALFSSRLNKEGLRVPYFLQIACEQNSNGYRLLHKIVDICDVNTVRTLTCPAKLKYGVCSYDHVTIFPSGSDNDDISKLLYHRDIPVIIDGFESDKTYSQILHDVVNISRRNKQLDVSDRLNVLPIFVCNNIKSTFKNVFSIDLTEHDIDDDYMELIEKNRCMLASWVYELVTNVKEYFEQNDSIYHDLVGIPEAERSLFDNFHGHFNKLRVECRSNTNLTGTDIENIGYLSYFFKRFMDVINKAWSLPAETKTWYNGDIKMRDIEEIKQDIVSKATNKLVEFHKRYSPEAQSRVIVNAVDLNLIDPKKVQKTGEKYAKAIIDNYRGYKVSIKILPDVEYKNERYVFTVKLLRGTHIDDISKYVDVVKRLMDLEFLSPVISANSIKLIASKKPLNENSLHDMLESQTFKESKMEIPYAVGYDIMGEMVFADIVEFPHLLIGGTSGSGKSSALHSLLMSIVYKQPTDKVKLLLLDFGASGLNMFDKTPHMLLPTIDDAEEGLQYLLKLRDEVKRREYIIKHKSDRDYERLPYIVCVVDEFQDFVLQLTQSREGRNSLKIINGLLSKARKAKIHLILSAQEPSTKLIEISSANLGARIAFRCMDWHKSQAIIGRSDAENLSGEGSMYFKCPQLGGLNRLQGSFMPPKEIKNILARIVYIPSSGKYEEVPFELEPTPDHTETPLATSPENSDEKVLIEIVRWIVNNKLASLSNNKLKKDWKMGYGRANLFLKRLEEEGIVSPPRVKLPRQIDLAKAEAFLKALEPSDYEVDDTEIYLPQAPEQEVDATQIQEDTFLEDSEPVVDNAQNDSSQAMEREADAASIQDDVSATRKTNSKKISISHDALKALGDSNSPKKFTPNHKKKKPGH